METLRFTVQEMLSLIGVVQCVYILVYMAFRSGRISRAGLAMAYFLSLGLAFLTDFAASAAPEITPYYFYGQWLFWFLGPPLSVLLILQIAQLSEVPALRYYSVLLLVPFAFFAAYLGSAASSPGQVCSFASPCENFSQWLTLGGLIAGALSLAAIWLKWGVIAAINERAGMGRAEFKASRERYWLILAIIMANVVFLAGMFGTLTPALGAESAVLIRTILGLGFVYLMNTSLFRIYPQSVRLYAQGVFGGKPVDKASLLTSQETEIAKKIEDLMNLQKVYQEPTYSRADLARECAVPEMIVSRVINVHFGKSFPQLVNEARVADAKRLLQETEAPIKVVAEEVGFNSLTSFNRVFKDITGTPPSAFRRTITGTD